MVQLLLLTSGQSISLAELRTLQRGLAIPPEADVCIVTQAAALGHAGLEKEANAFDYVVSLSDVSGSHDAALLSELLRVLRPGGTAWLQEPVATGEVAEQGLRTDASLSSAILLAGFAGSTEEADAAPLPVPSSWRSSPSTDAAQAPDARWRLKLVRTSKPAWEKGASFPLKSALPVPTAANGEVKPAGAAAWKLAAAGGEIDDELVDEDELLAEEDLAPPPSERGAPAGSTGEAEAAPAARKACKNCTCGRAEGAVKVPLTEEQLNNPTSSCGNCGLGDAFRCAGCPYLGLPPFKLGEKISLSSNMLQADV